MIVIVTRVDDNAWTRLGVDRVKPWRSVSINVSVVLSKRITCGEKCNSKFGFGTWT